MADNPKRTGNPDLGKFWTLANALSMVRLVIVMPAAWLIFKEGSLFWTMTLVLLAIATDYFDGRVARWSHTVSSWGKVLDPLADKIAGGLVVLALVARDSLPVWFLVLILVRDLVIFTGGIYINRSTGQVPSSLWSGKVAVTAIAVTTLAALLRADPEIMRFCLLATTALLSWSFLRYVVRFAAVVSQRMRGTGPESAASEGG